MMAERIPETVKTGADFITSISECLPKIPALYG
jgi:hypothetical protein